MKAPWPQALSLTGETNMMPTPTGLQDLYSYRSTVQISAVPLLLSANN